MFKNIIFFVIAVIALFSCSEDSTEPTKSDSVLIPLAIGNFWKFEMKAFDSTGTVMEIDTVGFTIVDDTLINGFKYFRFETSRWMTNKADGLYQYFDGEINQSILIFKYPISAGDSYTIDRGYQIDTMNVTSTNFKINSKIGTFNCIYYETPKITIYPEFPNDYSERTEVNILCPGKGIIGMEMYRKRLGGQRYLTEKAVIIEYHLEP